MGIRSSLRNLGRVRHLRFRDARGTRSVGLIVVAMLNCGTVQAAVPASEREVLVTLYAQTAGDTWYSNFGWNGPAGTECTWVGVVCDDLQEHVIEISLALNNLAGTLPDLAALPALQTFDVSSNA